jgi:hypothetical protein
MICNSHESPIFSVGLCVLSAQQTGVPHRQALVNIHQITEIVRYATVLHHLRATAVGRPMAGLGVVADRRVAWVRRPPVIRKRGARVAQVRLGGTPERQRRAERE